MELAHTISCGNVFRDLGLPDADELLAKADNLFRGTQMRTIGDLGQIGIWHTEVPVELSHWENGNRFDRVEQHRATVVELTDPKRETGFRVEAICNPLDHFSRREGRRIAGLKMNALLKEAGWSRADRREVFRAIFPGPKPAKKDKRISELHADIVRVINNAINSALPSHDPMEWAEASSAAAEILALFYSNPSDEVKGLHDIIGNVEGLAAIGDLKAIQAMFTPSTEGVV